MLDVVIRLTGTRPLVMHNVRLANPRDPFAQQLKSVSGKRRKTEENYEEMSHIEYLGGLYYDAELGPYVPGEWLLASLVKAAGMHRQGPKVQRGLLLGDAGDRNPLIYQGTRDREQLSADPNFVLVKPVKVARATVMRTRPCFRDWSCEVPLFMDLEVIDFDELREIADRAGRFIGIGDHHPMYGRFTAEVLKT